MFESGFFTILGAGVLFGVVHSTLASNRYKRMVARRAPIFAQKYYRLAYVLMAVITSGAYAAAVLLLPDKRIYAIPAPWVYLTLLIQLAAVFAVYLSMKQGGIFSFLGLDILLNSKLSAPAEKLNVGGFYRFMRHPIYSFSMVIMWLFPVMTWNLLAFFIGCTLYSMLGSVFEERRLSVQFGADYESYQKRTPAFIPNPFRDRS